MLTVLRIYPSLVVLVPSRMKVSHLSRPESLSKRVVALDCVLKEEDYKR